MTRDPQKSAAAVAAFVEAHDSNAIFARIVSNRYAPGGSAWLDDRLLELELGEDAMDEHHVMPGDHLVIVRDGAETHAQIWNATRRGVTITMRLPGDVATLEVVGLTPGPDHQQLYPSRSRMQRLEAKVAEHRRRFLAGEYGA